MGQAKDKANYEAWMREDKRIYFPDPSDPNGEIHVHDKFRNMEAIVVLMMRACVRSGIDLPLLIEGKTLDAEQRQQVAQGHYEAVAKNVIENINIWRSAQAAQDAVSLAQAEKARADGYVADARHAELAAEFEGL